MSKLFSDYKMIITPLTPIHVGSGEQLSPGEYFVFDENGGHVLYAIDMGYLGSKLAKGRDTLCRWIVDDPTGWVKQVGDNEIMRTMIRKYARFKAFVTNTVADEIRKRWGKPDSMLAVNTLQRPGAHAILPGSSIKGAVRTALLWHAVPRPITDPPSKQREVSEWERKVLGSRSHGINDDILRHLKIADCVAKGVETEILDAEHVGMRDTAGDQAQLIDYRECLPGILNSSESYTLEGSLVVASGHPHYERSRGRLDRDTIMQACREFYAEVLKADKAYWRGDKQVHGVYEKIETKLRQTPEAAPIRLGWGSGMDSISLNLAKPQGVHQRGRIDYKYRYNPKTRRVLDGCYPPGWAIFQLEEIKGV